MCEEKEWWEKTTLANVAAFFLVICGFLYGANVGNTEIVALTVGAGVGYLLKYSEQK